jgi:heavy metal sensor kinase
MKTPRFGSLRFKLSWTHGIAISLVIACVGLIRYHVISYRTQRAFDEDLLLDAKFFVSHLSITPEDFVWLTQGLNPSDDLTLDEFRSSFVVTDLKGQVVRRDLHSSYMLQMLDRGQLDGLLKQKDGFRSVTDADGTKYEFVSLLAANSGIPPPYIVHVGRSTAQFQAVLDESLLLFLYSIPLMLALSVPVGWYLAGRALKPFEEVALTAEHLTSENLNTQIMTSHQEEEIQRLVNAFNSMVSRLEASFRQMRQFNADAAHELRTPLAILQGENEIALRSPGLPDDVRAVLSSNLEELERLTRVVTDLLTLAEVESGTEILRKKPVELSALLRDLIEQMSALAHERNLTFEAGNLPDLRVQADDLWIRRALLNLIDNSIKYSKPGERIEIWLKKAGSMVQIGIRDHGIGIDPRDLPRIFDRLYRTDPARSRTIGGSGLGLSIVKWIIEAHHGQISVTSQPEQGTTIEISLPSVIS